MIGATGSRHLNRRRASSPCVTPMPSGLRRSSLAPPQETDEMKSRAGSLEVIDQGGRSPRQDDTLSLRGDLDSRTDTVGAVIDDTSPVSSRMASPPMRLSVPDLPPGMTVGRRRAVNTLDHKTCALLHSKLKGIRLEDVA